jgi:catechol 2,3-dioxygenase-like lactoylglutathione lyase family enzyme
MRPARSRHVALTVSDLEASVRWYRRVFELDEVRREESPDRRAAVLGIEGSPVQIGLVQHVGGPSGRFDPHVVGLDHAAWAVDTRAELDEWQRVFTADGVEHSPVVDLGHVAILNFKDPDGIALSLFWDAPST